MSAFNSALRTLVEAAGGRIDAFYFCPHLEPKDLAPGDVPCTCSKPAPGLLFEAAADFGIELRQSIFIGDKPSDLAAGRSAGCITAFLHHDRPVALEPTPDITARDLPAALDQITPVFTETTVLRSIR